MTMYLLDLTLPTAADNVALDEALLESAEAGELAGEVLRLWEPAQGLVVVGRSSQAGEEVRLEECRALGMPVVRRGSGGAAIVAGPGCLMYGLVLSYQARPELQVVEAAHRLALDTLSAALGGLVAGVARRGTSDLAWGERKFSGNSLRCKRTHLLYHGTLLYNFDLPLVERLLRTPPRQPEYRQGRGHQSFVCNVPLSGPVLRAALARAWRAEVPLPWWPAERLADLAARRRADPGWTLLAETGDTAGGAWLPAGPQV